MTDSKKDTKNHPYQTVVIGAGFNIAEVIMTAVVVIGLIVPTVVKAEATVSHPPQVEVTNGTALGIPAVTYYYLDFHVGRGIVHVEGYGRTLTLNNSQLTSHNGMLALSGLEKLFGIHVKSWTLTCNGNGIHGTTCNNVAVAFTFAE